MVKGKKTEKSIIEIIEDMIKSGESEEKILASLKDLGVSTEQAKRLVLLAQANTFALLKGEIKKMVLKEIIKERELSKEYINELLKKQGKEILTKSLGDVSGTIKQYSKKLQSDLNAFKITLAKKQREFEGEINNTVLQLTEITDRLDEKVKKIGNKLNEIYFDMQEVKIKGLGAKNRVIRWLLMFLGVVFSFTSLYLLVAMFGATISVDSLIIMVALGLIGVTMLFVATIV